MLGNENTSKNCWFWKYLIFFIFGYLVFFEIYQLITNAKKSKIKKVIDLMKKQKSVEKYNIDLVAKHFGEENFVATLVIGGGAAGYTAGLYLAQSGYEPSIILGKQRGGALAKSNSVQNWPGTIESKGSVVTKNIEEQAVLAGAKLLEEEVLAVDFSVWPFLVKTKNLVNNSIKEYRTLACMIATGSKPNKLNIEGESEFWGKGVTNCAICDASLVKNKIAVVVGGGDSAVTEALLLARYANKVYIFVRKSFLKAKKDLIDKLESFKNIEIFYETELKKIFGDEDGVSGILFQKHGDGEREMVTSGVFLAIGSVPNTALFLDYLKINSDGCIELGYGQETSMAGVFAAGDVTTQEFRQAVIASGDACRGALQIVNFLMGLGVYPQRFEEIKKIKESSFKIKQKGEKMNDNDKMGLIHVGSDADLKKLFDQAKAENKIVLLDFSAVWCGPCQRLLPILQSLASEFSSDVLFGKVDIDESSDLAQNYKIRGVPTLIIFDNHQNELKKIVGVVEKEFLVELFEDLKTTN